MPVRPWRRIALALREALLLERVGDAARAAASAGRRTARTPRACPRSPLALATADRLLSAGCVGVILPHPASLRTEAPARAAGAALTRGPAVRRTMAAPADPGGLDDRSPRRPRTELIGACPLFRGLAPRRPRGRRRARPIEVDFPAERVIARQGEIGTGFFIVVDGRVRVVRDGDDGRAPRPGRVLRRAVGAGRRAARRAGRDRRADALPRHRVAGTSSACCARSRAWRWRCSRSSPRRLREVTYGPPDLGASGPRHATATPQPPDRRGHLPVHGHRGLDPARRQPRDRSAGGRSSRATAR